MTKIEKSDSVFWNADTVKRPCYCSLAGGVRKTEIIRRQVQSTWSFNKKHYKKLVKKFTTAWMNGLDKTFPNMRCRSLNNCLRHLCSWKCWLPGSQWWWWPPLFSKSTIFFLHFWSTCPVYSSHKICFCLRNLYLILTRMKKTGVLGKWELSKWDFRA